MSRGIQIRPIHTQEQFEEFLRLAEELAREDSDEAREQAEVLIVLLDDFQRKHHPVSPPDPVDAIKYYMERNGLKPADLEPFIGPRQRVHEVLHGKRGLSKAMIQRLHEGTDIPIETLLGRAAPAHEVD